MHEDPERSGVLGRTDEVARCEEILLRAAGGSGSAVLIEGEPGIGKSALMGHLLATVGEGGFEVLAGRSDALERDRPFGGIADAISGVPGDGSRALFRNVFASSGSPPPPDRHLAVDYSFGIVDAVLELLEELAGRVPVVLALDDLQWADRATLLVLRALGRRLPHLPIALLLTSRPIPRSVELAEVVEGLLAGGASRIELGPLDHRSVQALASAHLGATPGPDLQLHLERAGGNPLYVTELLRSLQESGSIEVTDHVAETTTSEVPDGLRATILRRLAFLPDDAVRALRLGAVLGRTFDLEALAAVADESVATLSATLDPALRSGLLVGDGHELAFRHDLVHDAVYADIAPAIRVALHRAAGEALEQRRAPAVQVAVQYARGASTGDERAIRWLRTAAAEAVGQAPAVAVDLLERAVGLIGPSSRRDEVLSELVGPLILVGRLDDAERHCREALVRNPEPPIEWAFRTALAGTYSLRGQLAPAIQQHEAASRITAGDGPQATEAMASAAYLRFFDGDVVGADNSAEKALATGDATPLALAVGHVTKAFVAAAHAHVKDAVANARRAVEVARGMEAGKSWPFPPHICLGIILLEADELTEAEATFRRGRNLEADQLWALQNYQTSFAMVRFLAGEFDDAAAEATTGLALVEETGNHVGVVFQHTLLARIALHRDDLATAERSLSRAEVEYARVGPQFGMDWMLWAAALISEARGDVSRARTLLEQAWDLMAPWRYLFGYRFLAPELVRLSVGVDDDRARSVTETAEEGARRCGIPSAVGTAFRCRGLLEHDAETLLKAVEMYRLGPRPFDLAAACEDAATALAASGRTDDGVALLTEALDIYERLGAVRDLKRAQSSLRGLGVRHRPPRQRPRANVGWESLTETELAVVRLVAEGLTNRQIGDRLYISRRTVETHLSHVFAKLGLTTRARVAAEAARRWT